jgi:hypothetical protein
MDGNQSSRQTEHNISNVLAGVGFGALIGAGLGLGACIYIFEETLWFPGDTMLIGAVICGTLGFFLGEDFIDWLKEHWWYW